MLIFAYIKIIVDALQKHTIENDPEVDAIIQRLEEQDKLLRNDQGASTSGKPAGDAAVTAAPTPTHTPRAKGSAAALGKRRAALLGMAATQSTPSQQKLITARKNVASIMDDLLGLIADLRSLPMHEGLLFSRVGDIVKICGGFSGAPEPRHTVLDALRNPEKYLGSLEPSQVPDNVVAYQILSEGGKLVNLYDWYNTFSAIKSLRHTKRKTDHVQRLVFE